MIKSKTTRTIISLLLALLVLAGAVTLPVFETTAHAVTQAQINAKKAEKAALQQKIKAQEAKMKTLKEEEADLMERKTALDEQQIMKVEEINLIKEELAMYRQLIEEKREEARIAQENADHMLVLYRKHVRSMEEESLTNMYMELLFSSDSFGELITRIDMVGEIMEYDTRARANYLAARAAADTAREEYEAAAAELEVKEAELQAEIDRLEGELGLIQTELEDIQSNIKDYQSVIGSYEASERAIDKEIKAMEEQYKKEQTPPTATGNWTWPCPSVWRVTSKYGYRNISLYGYTRLHAGIDVGAPMGTPIVAADGGNVTLSRYDNSGYGSYVMINHGNGRVTLYAHMSARAVSVGQTVTKGQVIGYVGSTGNSTGPHLHFEIRLNGKTVDPLQYFSGYSLG